mgnify:CR=1 FL=1
MIQNIISDPIQTIFAIIALIMAISIHEYAHAWTAYYLGDPTPKIQGRITINTIKHRDPFGTIFLLLAGFGWGKPVMTHPNNYKNPSRDYVITSFAGPFANLIMAAITSLPTTIALALGYNIEKIAALQFTETVYYLNLLLFTFNLLPIYPLDGSKLIMYFIKKPSTMKLFITSGPIILLIILLLHRQIPILSWIFITVNMIFAYILRGLPLTLLT